MVFKCMQITLPVLLAQIRSYSFLQFLLLEGNKDDSTPFWFLKCRKMKSIISTIQSSAHLESWEKYFSKREVLTFQAIIWKLLRAKLREARTRLQQH